MSGYHEGLLSPAEHISGAHNEHITHICYNKLYLFQAAFYSSSFVWCITAYEQVSCESAEQVCALTVQSPVIFRSAH